MAITRQDASQSVAGACVLRDCVDIVPFLCGHYLRMGFAHLAFVDDGSTDGTYELLQRIAKRTSRVFVKQVHTASFQQPALVTAVVNGLIATGHSIIVPFDSDEFWDADATKFRSILAPSTEAVVEGRWVNFVQRKSRLRSTRLGLFSATHRAPHLPDAGQEKITTYTNSFLCFSIRKIAIKTAKPVKIERGQHVLAVGPQEVCGTKLEVLHLPFRSRAEILKRGLNYEPRRAMIREDRTVSWQSAFFGEAVASGKSDIVWAAHSCDSNGQIDIYGKPLAAAEDHRLRRTLIWAGWHFLTRTGLSPFMRTSNNKGARHAAEMNALSGTALAWLRMPLRHAIPGGVVTVTSKGSCRLTKSRRVEGAVAHTAPISEEVFDRNWYLAAYPDVAAAGVDPFEHYTAHAKAEGRYSTRDAAEDAVGF
jgi:hypothetical protein